MSVLLVVFLVGLFSKPCCFFLWFVVLCAPLAAAAKRLLSGPTPTLLQVKGTEHPPPRSGHASTSIREKIFCFGGMSADDALLNDLWIFDQDSLQWTYVTCFGQVPCARRGGSTCRRASCLPFCLPACLFALPPTCPPARTRLPAFQPTHPTHTLSFFIEPCLAGQGGLQRRTGCADPPAPAPCP